MAVPHQQRNGRRMGFDESDHRARRLEAVSSPLS
jgi:hypothetical protein